MSLGLTIVLQAAVLATSAETYSEAHKATTEKGYPLVVVVGASWCPACQEMKASVIPELKRHGVLHDVAFAQVDLDEEQQLGTQLTAGGPIPQVVVYRKTPLGWRLRRLIGGHDVRTVENFIAQGVAADEKDKPQPTPAKDKTAKATPTAK